MPKIVRIGNTIITTSFFFPRGANHMYIIINVLSKSTPSELMPERVQFSHPELTTGRPYQVYVRLLNKVKTYGMHEYSSTLPFLITLLNVNIGAA